jgi:hypothetical protein
MLESPWDGALLIAELILSLRSSEGDYGGAMIGVMVFSLMGLELFWSWRAS